MHSVCTGCSNCSSKIRSFSILLCYTLAHCQPPLNLYEQHTRLAGCVKARVKRTGSTAFDSFWFFTSWLAERCVCSQTTVVINLSLMRGGGILLPSNNQEHVQEVTVCSTLMERWMRDGRRSRHFLQVFSIFSLYTIFSFCWLTHSSKENFIQTNAQLQQCIPLHFWVFHLRDDIGSFNLTLLQTSGPHVVHPVHLIHLRQQSKQHIQRSVTVFYLFIYLLSFFFDSLTRFVTSIKPLIAWYTARVRADYHCGALDEVLQLGVAEL